VTHPQLYHVAATNHQIGHSPTVFLFLAVYFISIHLDSSAKSSTRAAIMGLFQSIWQRISAHLGRRQNAQQPRTTRQRSDYMLQRLEATLTKQAENPEITEQQPQTTKLTSLERLPVELLLSITDFLFPEDIFCLALCSSGIFVTLSRLRSNIKLPEGRGKLPFLQRLERDLPSHFICYCCFLLHKYDWSECYKLSNPQLDSHHSLSCVRNRKWLSEGHLVSLHWASHSYYYLYFLHVQLAMRGFFNGPKSGMTSDALAYTQVKEYYHFSTLISIEARICPLGGTGSGPSLVEHSATSSGTPNLCLRVQDIVLVNCDEVDFVDLLACGTPILTTYGFVNI
jgi:hypothetical protein